MSDYQIDRDRMPPRSIATEKPFSRQFFSPINAVQRKIYLKGLIGGCFMVIITIFAVFPIYWGALWKTPQRSLKGWIVDFDGGPVGQAITTQMVSASSQTKLTLAVMPSNNFPGGPNGLARSVVEQHTWVAVTINPGASERLQASYSSPNPTYDGSDAITVYGAEARNENAYRTLIRPIIDELLQVAQRSFALQAARQLSSSSDLAGLMINSPQTITMPISYKMYNVVPFDQPVASAVTFVGLIYVLILSFFVVMITYGAREAAGLNQNLTLRSLIVIRYVSSFICYFFLSLFYSLVSLAFHLDFTQKFGHGGFVIFWMLNWVGMLSVGLALEALIPLLTPRFIPFFMILWIIVNVAVCIQPIEALPVIYRYGYAIPFYNVSHAVRCIVFATRNRVGQNFGILLCWTAISCCSLLLIQW
ncbi:Nitrosoguanidine resistance protein SNG1, partial [Termitomyces sp. T112]